MSMRDRDIAALPPRETIAYKKLTTKFTKDTKESFGELGVLGG
jgi:hypothetical protein